MIHFSFISSRARLLYSEPNDRTGAGRMEVEGTAWAPLGKIGKEGSGTGSRLTEMGGDWADTDVECHVRYFTKSRLPRAGSATVIV